MPLSRDRITARYRAFWATHGELLKLGFEIAQSSVAKYIRLCSRPLRPDAHPLPQPDQSGIAVGQRPCKKRNLKGASSMKAIQYRAYGGYPMYEDFDLISTRAHVLYADALSSHSVEDIEEHFLNLVKFHAVQRADDKDWEFRGTAISDKDIEHLQGYVRRIKDTRFLQRLKTAVADFYTHRESSGFEPANISWFMKRRPSPFSESLVSWKSDTVFISRILMSWPVQRVLCPR
jgi:hypothetical protein